MPAALPPTIRSRTDRQAGFSLVELLVVFVIIGVLAGLTLVVATRTTRGRHDAAYRAAAATIWNGAAAVRHDRKGRFPTGAELTPQLASITGAPYVPRWPEDPATGGAMVLGAGSGAVPPAASPALADTVVFWSAQGQAWIAAYGFDGRVVFQRSATLGTVGVPVG